MQAVAEEAAPNASARPGWPERSLCRRRPGPGRHRQGWLLCAVAAPQNGDCRIAETLLVGQAITKKAGKLASI